jgi:hypothetical protein
MARMPARSARPIRTKPSTKKKAGGKPAGSRKSAARKATAKKAPAKKAPAKKAPAKKTLAKKAPAKKTLAKKTLAKKVLAKKAPAKKTLAFKATPARDAVQAAALKRTINQALTPLQNDSSAVESYMRDIDHPFKAEMEAVRAIILGVSDKISERIKWNAPSFFYKEDLGAFNPRASEYAHLILLFPGGEGMDDKSGLLEGNHKDRREAKFHSLDDVKAKKRALEKLVKNWLALRDR